MRRRTLLRAGGAAVGATLASGSGAVARADAIDEESPEPIELDGEGVSVTEELTLADGPTVIEATHTGSSTFSVQFVPVEDGTDYRLIDHTGAFDGSTGSFVEEGTYVVYVDADGAWELVVRQPSVTPKEAADPPLSIDGSGSAWDGPILFEDGTRIAALYEDNSSFRVDVVPQDIDGTEFVWNGGELIFDVIGPFAGATTVNIDGVGYIDVTAEEEWSIDIA
jgi:hypothetical protein